MRFSFKVFLFIVVFSGTFYLIRATGFYDSLTIIADLGGVPWLYAAIVTLFSILVGFILQSELENWNKLLEAVNAEADALRELWLWSQHLPDEYRLKFDGAIKQYLKEMSGEGLYMSSRGERTEEIENVFGTLQEVMFAMSQSDTKLLSTTFSFFSRLIEHRTSRLRYSYNHVPEMLRRTLLFAAFLVISLCLLIGIKDVWLDYVFTTSVALMAFIIFLVIDDLDHPLSHGNWHVTPIEYQILLERITKASQNLSS